MSLMTRYVIQINFSIKVNVRTLSEIFLCPQNELFGGENVYFITIYCINYTKYNKYLNCITLINKI